MAGKDDQGKGAKIIRISDFRKGDLGDEWYGVVQHVLPLQGDQLLNVAHHEALSSEDYIVADAVVRRAGRNAVKAGDEIVFRCATTPEPAAGGMAFLRIMRLRFL